MVQFEQIISCIKKFIIANDRWLKNIFLYHIWMYRCCLQIAKSLSYLMSFCLGWRGATTPIHDYTTLSFLPVCDSMNRPCKYKYIQDNILKSYSITQLVAAGISKVVWPYIHIRAMNLQHTSSGHKRWKCF